MAENPLSEVKIKDLEAIVQDIFETKAKCEALDEQLTELNKELARKEQKCIEILREHGLENFRAKAGLVTPIETVAYHTPKEEADRAAFFGYLKEQGLFDGMVTVHYQTLNSWASRWYEAAKERGDLFAQIPGLGAPNISWRLGKYKSRKSKE